MLHRVLPRVYEGWLVVFASAFYIVVLGAAVFFGFGTVFEPIRQEFGWSVAAMSLAFSLRTEVSGIAAPFIGVMLDRVGPRNTQLFGLVVTVTAMIGISFIQNIWQFYGAMMLISIGVSAGGGQVGQVAAATWFRALRGRALGLVTVGGGLSGLLVPVMAILVDEFGWRSGLRIIAAVLLVSGMVPVLVVRFRPRNHSQPMDGRVLPSGQISTDDDDLWGIPAGEAIRSRAFLYFAIGLAGLAFGTTALVVHQIPFMEARGISAAAAASTVTIFTLSSTIGRLGFGVLGDRYEKRWMMIASVGLAAAGVALLPFVHSLWQAVLVLMVVAPGFGGSIPLRTALVADYFGTRYMGTIAGWTLFVQTIGAFFGPLFVGRMVDVTGRYNVGWLITAAVMLATAPLFYLARPPLRLQEQYREQARLARAAGGSGHESASRMG